MSYRYCPKCASELVERSVDGEVRLACGKEDCDFIHFDNPTPVVAAIVELGTEVVLIQNKEWPDDWYGLVSGFLESEEHPREGVLREIREEINLEANLESLVGVYPFELMNQVLIVYHVTAEGNPEPGDELSDLIRVGIPELEPWDRGTGIALREWLEDRPETDF